MATVSRHDNRQEPWQQPAGLDRHQGTPSACVQSINLLLKVQSHHQNGLRIFLDNINTLIKQSDTDITEFTEIVREKQVTARIYVNSEGQQVKFHSAENRNYNIYTKS